MSEGARAAVYEIWSDLAVTMRQLRTGAGMSIRRAELVSGVGRGTLSQVETAKARPNRSVVEWYDSTFGGDGLLVALYAEARGAHGTERPVRTAGRRDGTGDAASVCDTLLALGALVSPGERVTAGWTLHNTGNVPWHGRQLSRVGPHTAARLVTSDLWTPLPDCEPGDRVRAQVQFTVPESAGTYAAYWYLTDSSGDATLTTTLPAIVVVGAHLS